MGRTGHISVLQQHERLHIICAWHLAYNVILARALFVQMLFPTLCDATFFYFRPLITNECGGCWFERCRCIGPSSLVFITQALSSSAWNVCVCVCVCPFGVCCDSIIWCCRWWGESLCLLFIQWLMMLSKHIEQNTQMIVCNIDDFFQHFRWFTDLYAMNTRNHNQLYIAKWWLNFV